MISELEDSLINRRLFLWNHCGFSVSTLAVAISPCELLKAKCELALC